MGNEVKDQTTRRQFLHAALIIGAAGATGATSAFGAAGKGKGKKKKVEGPTIITGDVMGKNDLIVVGQIGCGRIGTTSEIPGVLKNSSRARFAAACDLDAKRLAGGKTLIEQEYAKKKIKATIKTFGDYRELLADKSIDAVCISVPDFWHAAVAIEAAKAGKAIYLQKPASITISEGRIMADAVKKAGVIFQQGSQQRSAENFRKGCELVRNGAIGKLKEVHIGLPTDPALKDPTPEMPVPPGFNYDMWLGSTPKVPYTEKRCHPQDDVQGRPGWMCIEAYCAGMITNWGAHHVDIANWGMGTEDTGPRTAMGKATYYPNNGIWDVPATFHVEMKYANGVTMMIDAGTKVPNGVKFVGEEGWLFVSRGSMSVTKSDPTAGIKPSKALDASDPKILNIKPKADWVRLHASPSNDHHLDWLTAIKTKGQTVAPIQSGWQACCTCLVGQVAYKRDGKMLEWDSAKERFTNDEEANKLLSRPQRAPYGVSA